MDCDVLNFNILKNPTDAIGQFKWLEYVLRKAEKDNEVVYIIGHIPPGDTTYTTSCSLRYNALLDRFSNIILGNFYGHSHYDEFKTVHEYFNQSNVIGLIQITPSLTTYSSRHPSFRILDMDSESFLLNDYTQYFLNLTKANLSPDDTPQWEILYNASEKFGIKNLSDFNQFQEITKQLYNNNATIVNDTVYYFFGMNKDYETYKKQSNIGYYMGCRFDKFNYKDYMNCVRYFSWDWENELLNFFLDLVSGSWYNKFHDHNPNLLLK